MTKWEYATVPLLVHATKQILDTWGEDGPGRGSYYYRSRLEPLSLVEEDGGRWTEHAQGSDTGATWQFTERSADRLRGETCGDMLRVRV